MNKILSCVAVVLAVAIAVDQAPVFAQEPVAGAIVPGETGGSAIGTTNLMVNLRDAPLDLVLEHLAHAAGCKVVLEAKIVGTVAAFSGQSLSRVEAYNLLNTLLIHHGLAAIAEGDSLTIVSRDEAKTRGIPVRFGNDPQAIPRTDEIVTQVIPVQFTEAASVVKDLQPLLSHDTIISANESANTIVLTDVQTSIRRSVEIIRAIDLGTEEVIAVKVFRLRHADPFEMADLLTELFPKPTQTDNNQSQMQMDFGMAPGPGGMGFGAPGGMGGQNLSGGGTAGSSAGGRQRLMKGSRVTVAADQRTGSIIVSAPKLLIGQIATLVAQLDGDSARKEKIVVYHLKNASAEQVKNNLQTLFQKNNSTSTETSTTQTDPLEARSTAAAQTRSTGSKGSGAGSGNGGGSGGAGSRGQ